MGDDGLIDQKPGFNLECCFRGPVKCPAAAPVAYKIQHCCSYSIGFIDSRAALAWQLLEVASLLSVQTPTSSQCLALPAPSAVHAQPQPTNAHGTSCSSQGSPKHKSKPAGKDQSS